MDRLTRYYSKIILHGHTINIGILIIDPISILLKNNYEYTVKPNSVAIFIFKHNMLYVYMSVYIDIYMIYPRIGQITIKFSTNCKY